MEIIGQKVNSKATGIEVTFTGIEKNKVLVDVGSGKPISVPLDALSMPDDLKNEIQNKFNYKAGKNQKVLTGIAGIIDVRRAPQDIRDPKTIKELSKGDCLGTRSGDIYWDLVDNENFKWNPKVGYNFGRQRSLYSKDATPEGYSVWMLAHSSYNGSIAKSEKVFNKIEDNGDIVEVWNENATIPDLTLGEKRVVFVKNACGQYIFWGIVETAEVSIEKREVVHKYICEEYKRLND